MWYGWVELISIMIIIYVPKILYYMALVMQDNQRGNIII